MRHQLTVAYAILLLTSGGGLAQTRPDLSWEQKMNASKQAVEAADYENSQKILRTEVAFYEKEGPASIRMGISSGQLGMTLVGLGRYSEAVGWMRRGIGIVQSQ